MSGITYGQWASRMASQVANENASEYYYAKTQQVREETEKLRAQNELLKQQIALLENAINGGGK